MNVYDFDKTIYSGDCSVDFYVFCIKRKPPILLYLAKQVFGMMRYAVGRISKEQMKEYFFSFLNVVENVEDEVKRFWDENEIKIKKWYLEQQKFDDVVISASPEFLLEEICNRLKIRNLIATKVNTKNGKIIGKNCKGEEKLKQYEMCFSDEKIDRFYTDSLSDIPLCRIAKEAYIVKNEKISKWNDTTSSKVL